MEFIVFCAVVGFLIYSLKKRNNKQISSNNTDVYPAQVNTNKKQKIYFIDKKENDDTTVSKIGDVHIISADSQEIILRNVVDIQINKIIIGEDMQNLVSKENWTKKGTIYYDINNLENVFIIAIQKPQNIGRYDDRYDLIFYEGSHLIKKVENVYCYYRDCKMTINAEVLCKQILPFSPSCHAKETNALKITKNGDVIVLKDIVKNSDVESMDLFYMYNNEVVDFDLFDKSSNVCIYFYKKECPSYYIAMEFCKNADEFKILPNKFKDDYDTINYCAKYKKTRIEDIGFLSFCFDRRFGQSSFSVGLYGSKKRPNTCGGTAVYNLPIADYYKGLEGKFLLLNETSQAHLTNEQRENFKEIINVVYQKYNKSVNYDELPREFLNGMIYEDIMLNKLCTFVDQYNGEYKNTKDDKFIWSKKRPYFKEMKEKYQNIKQKLILEGIIKTTWISELELFKLTYKYYPTSIYQYHAKWLGAQSLDIYIPDLKIAIEYQGLQHYEPVEHFGGEEDFKHRQELDIKKKKLCKNQGIKLIEWKYNEKITKLILDKKLQEVNKIAITQ